MIEGQNAIEIIQSSIHSIILLLEGIEKLVMFVSNILFFNTVFCAPTRKRHSSTKQKTGLIQAAAFGCRSFILGSEENPKTYKVWQTYRITPKKACNDSRMS